MGTLEGQSSQYRVQIAQYRIQMIGVEAQKQAVSEQIVLLGEELIGFERLDEKGLTVTFEVCSLRGQIAEMRGQEGQLVAELHH